MNNLLKFLENFSLKEEKERTEGVIQIISRGVIFKGTNLWILVFAIFIASLGLNVNSTAVIIGAMLVSPIMGPIMGMGLSLGINDLELLKKSLKNYMFATGVGLLTSTIYFLMSPLNEAHSEILARTQPNIYDVLIAFFGGLAGIVATSSKHKGNVIPGVAIATALMPPLCTAGFGLATFNFTFFVGAFYLFFINSVFIAFATLITVRLLDFPLKHLADEKAEKKSRQIITFIVLLTLIPSIYFGYDTINQTRFKSNALKFIELESKLENDYLLKQTIDPNRRVITLIYGGENIEEKKKQAMYLKLKNYGLEGANLIIQQGFSNDKSIVNDPQINTVNESMIALEKENSKLRNKIDSLKIDKSQISQLLSEVKTLFPQITSIIVQPTVQISSNSENTYLLVVIDTKKKISSFETKKLISWLKTRLKNENIKLLKE